MTKGILNFCFFLHLGNQRLFENFHLYLRSKSASTHRIWSYQTTWRWRRQDLIISKNERQNWSFSKLIEHCKRDSLWQLIRLDLLQNSNSYSNVLIPWFLQVNRRIEGKDHSFIFQYLSICLTLYLYLYIQVHEFFDSFMGDNLKLYGCLELLEFQISWSWVYLSIMI